MSGAKPEQFTPRPSGNAQLDRVQRTVSDATDAIRQQPPPSQTVTSLSKSSPGQGITFKPGQTVDIPHNLGRIPNGFNIAKVLTNTPKASSAPYATPNLQVVEVPGPLGQKIMRLRYIAPKDDQGNDVMTPVRLNLEIT
jgi:hypothetical protein